MTPAQYERLPAVLREIVDTDREIEAETREIRTMICAPFVRVAALAEKRRLRADQRRAAEQLWGHRLGGDRNGAAG